MSKLGFILKAPLLITFVLVSFVISVSAWSDDGTLAQNIDGCGILNTTNSFYTLNASITNNALTTPCLNITAQNITLDCFNFSNYILSDDAKSGVYSNQPNTTIKNCNVTMSSSSGGYGIYLVRANNSLILNCSLNGQYRGLYATATSNSNISELTANDNYQYGIYLVSSTFNVLNNIIANSNIQYGIYLASGFNNLSNIITNNCGSGLFLSYSQSNSINGATSNENNQYGIYIRGINNQISNLNVSSNSKYGVFITNFGNNTLANITEKYSSYGIYVSLSGQNNISSSSFSKNAFTSYDDVYTNNFLDTNFLDNMNTYSIFSTASQEGYNENRIDFNLTMNYVNGSSCPLCSYNADLYPNENLVNSSNGALIIGNFTPTRVGIYSLNFNITDTNGNIETRKYVYLINVTSSELINYYFRKGDATHGQPKYYGASFDSGYLSFDKPTTPESIYCDTYLGLSVDALPPNLFGIYSQINYSMYYNVSNLQSVNWTGIQRYGETSTSVDYNSSINNLTSMVFESFSFNPEWVTDYLQSWYLMTIKIGSASGSNPSIFSNATNPSFANITYSYSNTPAIKSISNEDIDILSATMESNTSTSANITLKGSGSTNISILMPNESTVYSVTLDGILCPNINCIINYNSNGEINLTLTLLSSDNLDIFESLPYTTPPPGGGGGTGGNSLYNTGITNLSVYLCEKTYMRLTTEIHAIIEEILREKRYTESFTLLEAYISHWQQVCSDTLNLTLEPSYVCNKVYYSMLGKTSYNSEDILNLRDKIEKVKLSLVLVEYYVINYNKLCYQLGYSGKLQELKNEDILTVSNDSEECDLDINNEFLDWTFPTKLINFKVVIGAKCKDLNTQRWFISYEKVGETIYFRGIRFYLIFFPILFYFAYRFIKEGQMMKWGVN